MASAIPDAAFAVTTWEGPSAALVRGAEVAQARCRSFLHVPEAAIVGTKDLQSIGDGWTVKGEDPQILVDTSMLPGLGRCLRLDVSVDRQTRIELFFPNARGEFSKRRSVSRQVDPAETEIFVVLPDLPTGSVLRIDPGVSRAGAITIKGLFAGEMPAP